MKSNNILAIHPTTKVVGFLAIYFVNYEIKKSPHSVERQYRHIDTVIDDEHVKTVINRGIDKLVRLTLSKAINIGDKVHIKDTRSDLNIVIVVNLEREADSESIIRFDIVTVMKAPKFHTGNDTKGPIVV